MFLFPRVSKLLVYFMSVYVCVCVCFKETVFWGWHPISKGWPRLDPCHHICPKHHAGSPWALLGMLPPQKEKKHEKGKKCLHILWSDLTIPNSLNKRVPVALYIYQSLLFLVFIILTILVAMKWFHDWLLIIKSMTVNNVALFVCLCILWCVFQFFLHFKIGLFLLDFKSWLLFCEF